MGIHDSIRINYVYCVVIHDSIRINYVYCVVINQTRLELLPVLNESRQLGNIKPLSQELMFKYW